jgi:glutamate 5-kinase
MRVIVKIGSSSLTDDHGRINVSTISHICEQIAGLRQHGQQIVLVTSGAVAAGLAPLGLAGKRPRDPLTLQAVSAVGQSRLMQVYNDVLEGFGVVGAQVLLSPLDFMTRQQYLHARDTLFRLLELGALPIINENDAVADDELRFGDNDRIAALVAHLLSADMLVLLTDTGGLYTSDPHTDPDATLIEEVGEIDASLEAIAGGAGTARGSGGMASKLAAAKIASWSGVRTVIASAGRPGVIASAVAGERGVGTAVFARRMAKPLPARKLWIAFAVSAEGTVAVDSGAQKALVERGVSLLAAGITGVTGDFAVGDPVDIAGPSGVVFARGLTSVSSDDMRAAAGRRSTELPEGAPAAVVHRDDLVVLP